MKQVMLCLLSLATISARAQSASDSGKIDAAEQQLKTAIISYSSCVIDGKLQSCIKTLVTQSNDPYKQYVSGGMLYTVDPVQSMRLHQSAYKADSTNRLFMLEYALEQHRKGAYATALPIYQRYVDTSKEQATAYCWMADCYINTNNPEDAIKAWKLANHASHHTEIDFAIHTVYGRNNLFMQRDTLRSRIEAGEKEAAYTLVFQDMNWEFDWWNVGIQRYFLDADRSLIGKKISAADQEMLQLYVRVKDLSNGKDNADSIRAVLEQYKILLGNNPLFPDSRMCSDLLRICCASKVLTEADFYKERGAELLKRASLPDGKEWLNMYAWLQSVVQGKVDADIDLKGWKTLHDERFAVSYFIGKGNTLRYDDAQLEQALKEFPHSAMLSWIKANLAHDAQKPVRSLLVTLIRNEFKTLGSDENHYSDRLNMYFDLLEQNKQ